MSKTPPLVDDTNDAPQTPAAPDARTGVTYVGPPEQSHPDFGPLVAGRRYQIQADLAAYLCSTHPDYWQAVAQTVKE